MLTATATAFALALALVLGACDSAGADEPLACEVADECAEQCVPVCDLEQPDYPAINCNPCDAAPDVAACYAECNQAKDDARAEWQAEVDKMLAAIDGCGAMCGVDSGLTSVCAVAHGVSSVCEI